MARKNALGRGLGALIETEEQAIQVEKASGVNEISVDNIEANPFQPRSKFDEEALHEMASSVRELGIIQPITVREISEHKYQLITGERRLKASVIAGLKTIPAYIRTANDQELLEMALVENIQREDLDAIEVAISYQRLMEECQLTQENLSVRVGMKRATVTNYVRLLKLPAEIQLGIRENKISMGHARALININDENEQLKIFHEIIEKDLSVRKVEGLVRKLNKPKPEQKPDATQQLLPNNYEELQSHLSKFFQTDINFTRNNKGAGKIVIPFKSDSELERIIVIFDMLNE